ncbi:hypothetical protein [Rickettsiella massiliensis]|uniref:hypothetical protein n=1 Tax=Rickettsiella massiliensis TaxID=676517 RepID=UPI0012EAC67D|nr:hypothetical protein [Rickettsiella massiliensis]
MILTASLGLAQSKQLNQLLSDQSLNKFTTSRHVNILDNRGKTYRQPETTLFLTKRIIKEQGLATVFYER